MYTILQQVVYQMQVFAQQRTNTMFMWMCAGYVSDADCIIVNPPGASFMTK